MNFKKVSRKLDLAECMTLYQETRTREKVLNDILYSNSFVTDFLDFLLTEDLPLDWWKQLISRSSVDECMIILDLPNLTEDLIKIFAEHENPRVRGLSAIAKNCPKDILEKLSKDENHLVSITAQYYLNPSRFTSDNYIPQKEIDEEKEKELENKIEEYISKMKRAIESKSAYWFESCSYEIDDILYMHSTFSKSFLEKIVDEMPSFCYGKYGEKERNHEKVDIYKFVLSPLFTIIVSQANASEHVIRVAMKKSSIGLIEYKKYDCDDCELVSFFEKALTVGSWKFYFDFDDFDVWESHIRDFYYSVIPKKNYIDVRDIWTRFLEERHPCYKIIAALKSPNEVANEMFKNYDDDLIRLFICKNGNLTKDTILRIANYYNGYSVIPNYEFKNHCSCRPWEEIDNPITILRNPHCSIKLQRIIEPNRRYYFAN